jgi:hypothetical protein
MNDRFGPYFCEPIIAGLSEDNVPFICTTDLIGAKYVLRRPALHFANYWWSPEMFFGSLEMNKTMQILFLLLD